jgi:hypothetical protein
MLKTGRIFGLSFVAAGALALAACGGSSDSSGVVSFSMTDAPVHDVDAVVISMTEFELKPASGESFRVPVEAAGRELNLLDFTNGESAKIIDAEAVPAGEYEWLRIFFDEGLSYVKVGDEQYSVFIPSGAQTGYKVVSGFTVPANGSVEYMLDFDVAKSLREPPGRGRLGEDRSFMLKPTVRIMDVSDTGGVTGLIASELLAENNDETTCAGGDAVYAFEGGDVDPLAADVEPLVSDIVDRNEVTGDYEYHVMYLLEGAYTLAFTCSASADGGDGEDYVYTPGELDFSDTLTVDVVDGEVAVCDLGADGAWSCAE